MAVRGWLNTNYYNFDKNTENLKERPFFSGFVLLSPRQKRFLAHVSSNKEAYIGDTQRYRVRGVRVYDGQHIRTLFISLEMHCGFRGGNKIAVGGG